MELGMQRGPLEGGRSASFEKRVPNSALPVGAHPGFRCGKACSFAAHAIHQLSFGDRRPPLAKKVLYDDGDSEDLTQGQIEHLLAALPAAAIGKVAHCQRHDEKPASKKAKKFRVAWTEEETQALRAGIAVYGRSANKWSLIKSDPLYAAALAARSNVNLKDRWRCISGF